MALDSVTGLRFLTLETWTFSCFDKKKLKGQINEMSLDKIFV